MKNFARNLNVKWRLVGFVCFLLLLLICGGLAGLYGIRTTNLSLSDVYRHKIIAFEELREIDHIFQSGIIDAAEKTLFNKIPLETGLKTIRKSKLTLNKKWAKLFSLDEEQIQAGNKKKFWLADSKDFIAESDETIRMLILYLENNDFDSLDTFTDAKMYPMADKYHQMLNSLIQERLRAVRVSYEKSQKNYTFFKRAFLITILFGVIISAMASYLLIISVYVPLNKIITAMKQVIKGDLTQHLEFGRHDEFGLLIKGFNQMVTYLRELVSQIQKSGIQVTSSITELAATNKQQEVTANEHAATTSEIAASTTQIAATGSHLLTTMKKLNSLTKNAAFAAEEGQGGLKGLDSTMVKMEEATGAIVTKLQILNDKAGNIAGVVRTINKIADQTNLLSLNAAIEAEKAGEYGSGFAVVATEIRRLADQTAVATFDIAQMVKEVQSAISAAVMGIDKFAEDAHTSVSDVHLISEQLSGVIEQVEVIMPQVETLTEGIDAQTLGANQISEAIAQLNEAAQHTAESLTQTSVSISKLHEAALGLQEGAARFKVEADSEYAPSSF